MTTAGYVFLLVAALLARALSKGRTITDVPGDLGAFFTALVSQDSKALKEVLSRTGESTLGSADGGSTSIVIKESGRAQHAAALLAETRRLGAGSRYVLGAEGPTGEFDCSGLVWRAMTNLHLFNGARFTTYNFESVTKGFVDKVEADPVAGVMVGAIVLWREHMGIVSGRNTYYSAKSPSRGIGESTISSFGAPVVGYYIVK